MHGIISKITEFFGSPRAAIETVDQGYEILAANWLEGHEDEIAKAIASNRFTRQAAKILHAIPASARVGVGIAIAEWLAHADFGDKVPTGALDFVAANLRAVVARHEAILSSDQLSAEEIEGYLETHFNASEDVRKFRQNEDYVWDGRAYGKICDAHAPRCGRRAHDNDVPMSLMRAVDLTTSNQAQWCIGCFPRQGDIPKPPTEPPTPPPPAPKEPSETYLAYATLGHQRTLSVDDALMRLQKDDILNMGGHRKKRGSVRLALLRHPESILHLEETSEQRRDEILKDCRRLHQLDDIEKVGNKLTDVEKAERLFLIDKMQTIEQIMRGFINLLDPLGSPEATPKDEKSNIAERTATSILDHLNNFMLWAVDASDELNSPELRKKFKGVTDKITNPENANWAGRQLKKTFWIIAILLTILLGGALVGALYANIAITSLITDPIGNRSTINSLFWLLLLSTLSVFGGAIVLQAIGQVGSLIVSSLLGVKEFFLGDSASDQLARALIPQLKKAGMISDDMEVTVNVVKAQEQKKKTINHIAHFSWVLTLVAMANSVLKAITLMFMITLGYIAEAETSIIQVPVEQFGSLVWYWEMAGYGFLGLLAVFATLSRDKISDEDKKLMAKQALQTLLILAAAWLGAGLTTGLVATALFALNIAHTTWAKVIVAATAILAFASLLAFALRTLNFSGKKTTSGSTPSNNSGGWLKGQGALVLMAALTAIVITGAVVATTFEAGAALNTRVNLSDNDKAALTEAASGDFFIDLPADE